MKGINHYSEIEKRKSFNNVGMEFGRKSRRFFVFTKCIFEKYSRILKNCCTVTEVTSKKNVTNLKIQNFKPKIRKHRSNKNGKAR